MIVGLTGRNASGKGTVAAWFQARGFRYTSLSDAIRVWLAGQGKEPTRDHLIWGGRTLRREGGPGVLAERTLGTIATGADVIVDSIRNPAEVEVLRVRADFVLIEVHASESVRWQRLAARGRAGDAATLEEFRRQELAELSSADSAAQQLVATAALADIIVPNDGTEADLTAQLHDLWQRLRNAPPS